MTTRDPHLDNARGLLIGLVVLGHVLTPLGTASARALDLWIYTFHMAAFVTVSGYVARRWTGSPRQAAAVVTSLLVPYVALDLVHGALTAALTGEPFRVTLLTPGFSLWFLLALALWRLTTPVLRVLRHPVALAVTLSLLLPLDRALDSTLSLGRVVGFLPFYALGACADARLLERLRALGTRWRLAAGAYLLVLLGGCVLLGDRVTRGWFFLDGSYASLDLDPVPGLVVRAVCLVGGLAGTVAVLLLAPRGTSWLTRWGRNSLAIYVLHALAVRPWLASERVATLDGPLVVGGAACGAALLTALLGLDVVSRGLDAVLRPAWLARRLVAPQAEPQAAPQAAPRRGAPGVPDLEPEPGPEPEPDLEPGRGGRPPRPHA